MRVLLVLRRLHLRCLHSTLARVSPLINAKRARPPLLGFCITPIARIALSHYSNILSSTVSRSFFNCPLDIPQHPLGRLPMPHLWVLAISAQSRHKHRQVRPGANRKIHKTSHQASVRHISHPWIHPLLLLHLLHPESTPRFEWGGDHLGLSHPKLADHL